MKISMMLASSEDDGEDLARLIDAHDIPAEVKREVALVEWWVPADPQDWGDFVVIQFKDLNGQVVSSRLDN